MRELIMMLNALRLEIRSHTVVLAQAHAIEHGADAGQIADASELLNRLRRETDGLAQDANRLALAKESEHGQ